MNRKEFLEKIGIGAAFALTATCLGGCSKDVAPEPEGVDFTIDLNDVQYSELSQHGKYVVIGNVVVARSIHESNTYLAATLICSHENYSLIKYRETDGLWYCTKHGAEFHTNGEGVENNDFANKGLTVYKTELLENNRLRVYSEE